MNKAMKEVRMNQDSITNLPGSRKVEGYAVVFQSESNDLGGFKEVIDSRALDGIIEKSDVLCLLNHNVDEKGLKYSFEAPNTALGDEVLEGIRRGDISASSFAFTVESDSWEKREDGSYLRTIRSISQLFDVSPVYSPAYSATSVKADTRGLDKFKDKEKEDLAHYFEELRKSL